MSMTINEVETQVRGVLHDMFLSKAQKASLDNIFRNAKGEPTQSEPIEYFPKAKVPAPTTVKK